MTELQSALLLRRQLAGERAGGGAPARAAITASSCLLLLSSSWALPGGRPDGQGEAAAPGEAGSGPARLGNQGASPSRAHHFFPCFLRALGAGTRPSLGPRTGPAAPGEGGEVAPSPTVRWDVAGEGL